MSESLWVIMPLKELEAAKQRLAGVLTPLERQRLFCAMVCDTLAVVSAHTAVAGTLLVSSDPSASSLAFDYGVECLAGGGEQAQGLNEDLQDSVQHLAERRIERVLILPGDLPLLRDRDISAMQDAYKRLSGPALVIAPDRHGCGTNGLLFDPRRAPTLVYGPNSCLSHRQQAQHCGLSVAIVSTPGLGRDIDLPEDLRFLSGYQAGTEAANTRDYLCASGIASRLHKAVNDDALLANDRALTKAWDKRYGFLTPNRSCSSANVIQSIHEV